MMAKIKLGDKVKCKVTDFVGIVTSITLYLNGCTQCGITPKMDKDGKYPDSLDIDIQQLEKIPKERIKLKKSRKVIPPGGPSTIRKAPIRR